MSPSTRKTPSKREPDAPSKRKGTTAASRKPKSSPRLRKAHEENLARVEELAELYRPLREAGKAELAKTASGRRSLKAAEALGTQLSELYKNIYSGKTPYEEGHRLAQRRREEFRDKHQATFLEAHARHIRLQPSAEAVAQILQPEIASQTTWVSETGALGAMQLQPKPTPEELGTVAQGLDPTPQPVHLCRNPPYTRREEQFYTVGIPGLSGTSADANVDGHLFIQSYASTEVGVAQSTSAEAWVGSTFPVPAGISSYALTVDYDWAVYQGGWAWFGVAVASYNVAILIDKGDGTPAVSSPQTVSLLTVPFAGGDYATHEGRMRATFPFTRQSDQGTVKVLVGEGCHSDVWALSAGAWVTADAFIREICLDSKA